MKKIFALYIFTFSQIIIAQSIYSVNAGFFDNTWTVNDFKFVMIEVVTMVISMLMLFLDEKTKNPNFVKIVLNLTLTSLFVYLVYEWAIHSNIPIFLAMIVAFFLGSFSMMIMIKLTTLVGPALEKIVDGFTNWVLKKLP